MIDDHRANNKRTYTRLPRQSIEYRSVNFVRYNRDAMTELVINTDSSEPEAI